MTHEDERTVLYRNESLDGTKPNTNIKINPKTNPNPNLNTNLNPKLTQIGLLTLFSCFAFFEHRPFIFSLAHSVYADALSSSNSVSCHVGEAIAPPPQGRTARLIQTSIHMIYSVFNSYSTTFDQRQLISCRQRSWAGCQLRMREKQAPVIIIHSWSSLWHHEWLMVSRIDYCNSVHSQRDSPLSSHCWSRVDLQNYFWTNRSEYVWLLYVAIVERL